MDDDWITIKGTHVLVDDDKNIKAGPEKLKNLPKGNKQKKYSVVDEMKPRRTDYEYDPKASFGSFMRNNAEKMQDIYDEFGREGIEDEWFRLRLNDCTGDFKRITDDEIDEAFDKGINKSTAMAWLVEYNSHVKPGLVMQLTSSKEVHNAALNVMYENYLDQCKSDNTKPLSFEKFLVTPIKMYRGGSGREYRSGAAFSSYTFSKDVAERFKSDPTGHSGKDDDGVIYEAEIRPIDTYGSLNTSGESEIFVPRPIAPNKNFDEEPRMDWCDWEWYDPVKWTFEDLAESKINEPDFSIDEDLLDSIIQDAEMIELFASSKSEKDKEIADKVIERCIDSIQRGVGQMTALHKAQNGDSAFFEGELDSDLGEKEKLYPGGTAVDMDAAWDEWLEEHLEDFESDDEQIKFRDGEWGGFKPKDAEAVEDVDSAWDEYKKKKKVDSFRERRQKRLDAKKDDMEWITVNGTHVPIDDDGSLGGKVGETIEKNVEKAEERSESPDKKLPLTKARFNQKLSEIADSDMSDDEKIKAIKSEFPKLRPGTKIIMPESWNSDDGKPQTYTYDGMRWNDDNDWGGMSEEDMAYYFLDKDPNERPKIKSIPRDPDSVEASRKKREVSKHYAMHPDGSINGKYTKDFHNDHVSQEERNSFAKEIKDMVDYEKGWDPDRSLYRGEANRVGDRISAEIKRRAALRRGDKENAPINDQPQVEDIYDVLKDMRDFGPPDGFNPKINSDLPKERTDAIVKEALDRFPTDWLRDADSLPVINIIDGPGRAICLNTGYINVYTQKDLGLSSGEKTTLNDRALVNDLAHELGHYIEWSNQKVQYSARDCLWERGKDSEIVDVEPGYQGYKDSFFNTYMGKIYSHGGTEIISMLMGNIGCFQPFSVLEGHEYDYSKGKYDGRKKKDKESLGYILGVLAGL